MCVWVWYPQSENLAVGSMWYRQTVWEAHRVFALGTVYCDYWLWECLHGQSVSRKWRPFGSTEHVVFLGWCVAPDFRLLLPRCCAQFVPCFDVSKVAVKLLVEKYLVPMSAVALCSGRQSPFFEVRFEKRLPRREAEHPSPYCPIPYGAKRYT